MLYEHTGYVSTVCHYISNITTYLYSEKQIFTRLKSRLHEILRKDEDFTEEDYAIVSKYCNALCIVRINMRISFLY